MTTRSAEQLARNFRDLNDFLHSGGAASTARQRLVELATSSIKGCDWAGITVRPTNAPAYSLTRWGAVMRQVDEYQYELGEGPCLEAARTQCAVTSPDLAREDRWPRFAGYVLAHSPVRGAMSFPLSEDPSPTALNVYSATIGALDEESAAMASVFAVHASVLVVHADSVQRAATLEAALATSRQIGAAIGILMAMHRIPEAEAFSLLRRASNQLNRKLRDIACDVTERGELPTKTPR